ncbi:LOW QUALITY PROTEIN: sialic acid-binding Ig-like lectin 14 [Bos mutus]|uniref:LOW QUALITY PROTEIN: sialic acid-binding Ig-like lectin 14 n=1 Tax=Bos mutus TaxID=72004 RepID=UPI0038B4E490
MQPLLLLPPLWAGSLAYNSRYWLDVQPSVSVQEGLCIRVPCSIYYPREGWKDSDAAHGYWFLEGVDTDRSAVVATNNPAHVVLSETQGRFLLLGDPRTKDCSLDIREAQRRDTGVYFFRLERGPTVKYNYKWHLLSVHVTALTDTPDIHVQGTLASGRPTNLTCVVPWACERGTPPTFSWTGVALTSLHPESPHSSVLTLTLQPQDHGTNLTCLVSFPGAGVSTYVTIRLNVSFPKILGNATSLRVWDGQSLRLVCVIDSNPPANVSWSRGSLTLSPSQPLDPGVLELPRVVLGDGGEVTRRAQHPSGSSLVSLNLVVLGVSSFCPQDFGENQGSWPLVLTLLRGALMGAGFLLTCGLSWIYYSRSVDKEVLKDLAPSLTQE